MYNVVVMLTAEFCKKIAEEPSSSSEVTAEEKPVVAEPADETESVFSASTLKATSVASIIMNIRVSSSHIQICIL